MSVKIVKPESPRIEPHTSNKLRKSDRTRAAILDAALEFLWTQPFRDMTVNRLMELTGASRSSFYQYFKDLHELMETLLNDLRTEIISVADPWLTDSGDVRQLLSQALAGLVRLSYKRGPILRGVVDATPTDKRLEQAWMAFLGLFDDAVETRIKSDQAQGLIAEEFDAREVAIGLNRMDAYMFIHEFGQHPRKSPEIVLAAIEHIWLSTLYASPQAGSAVELIRKE